LVSILAISISQSSHQADALSCGPPKFSGAFLEHDLLLHGNLIEKEIDYIEYSHEKQATLTFETIKVYKGQNQDKFTIDADLTWDDYYREGSDYVLFADQDGDNYIRELCVGDYVSSPSIIKFLDEFLVEPEIGEDVFSLYDVVRGFERDDLDIRINVLSSLNKDEIPVPKKVEFDNVILEPFENNDLVIIGKVIEVNTILAENKTQYHIQVEEYLKGERKFDLITATLDNIKPPDFPKGHLDYYNIPFFEKENQVFVYLKQEGSTFEMSPYSFTIKKQNVAGPPTVIHPTGPQGHFISQGDEIVISGMIKKGYLYGLGKSELDASFNLVVLNERGEQVAFKKLSIALDGSYTFPFQNKGDLGIPGNYSWEITFENGGMGGEFVVVADQKRWTPLKQFNSGIPFDEIQCKDSLVLIQKFDGSPACVKSVTKQHLMDRGWAEQVSFDKIKSNPELMKQNIIRIEDGRISLYPENTCASISLFLPTEKEIQRYKNDEKGLNESNTLQITSGDFNEIPIIEELIYAVNTLEFPYNKYSSADLDGLTFVEYEFFLMEKAIEKYGGSQKDYFIKLDNDYKERFANPAKQGFTNTFEAPLIVYNNQTYSVGSTVFWVSDEHEPKRMNVYPDEIKEDEKFIVLTDEDMKSVPKIKQAIEDIGTIQESINGRKGLPEDQWNEYREWFKQKSQEQLNADRFRMIQYDEQFYSVAFGIC
jgi:hypothetical protein